MSYSETKNPIVCNRTSKDIIQTSVTILGTYGIRTRGLRALQALALDHSAKVP